MTRFKGFWWRPKPNADVTTEINMMKSLGVTDVSVWAEPFVQELHAWKQVRKTVQQAGIRFHTWITVNHHYGAFFTERLRNNPSWAAVSRDGASCLESPFAGFQYWLCPANTDRLQAEWEDVWKPFVLGSDGLNLDYIRYPDGFRFGEKPEVLRREVADQSYCYCQTCRQRFREQHGVDPLDIPVDETDEMFQAWQRWRQDHVVNQVRLFREWLNAIDEHQMLTVAVFPTPDIARRNVQQDWPRFEAWVDYFFPMIYSKQFWGKEVDWTETAVLEGISELQDASKLASGLGPDESFDDGDFFAAIKYSQAAGSGGEMVFVFPVSDKQVDEFRRAWGG